jgi:hypothetical protein
MFYKSLKYKKNHRIEHDGKKAARKNKGGARRSPSAEMAHPT